MSDSSEQYVFCDGCSTRTSQVWTFAGEPGARYCRNCFAARISCDGKKTTGPARTEDPWRTDVFRTSEQAEAIAARLGLEPLDEFALKRYQELLNDPKFLRDLGLRDFLECLREGRNTGNTTRMLCEALAHIESTGEYAVIDSGMTLPIERGIVMRGREMAVQLGIPEHKLITSAELLRRNAVREVRGTRKVSAAREFRDRNHP